MTDKCNVCGKFISDSRAWICEECGNTHCPECSRDSSEGTGEYPSEDAFSICAKCCNEMDSKKSPVFSKTQKGDKNNG